MKGKVMKNNEGRDILIKNSQKRLIPFIQIINLMDGGFEIE